MTESNTKKANKPVLLSAAALACLVILGGGFWMGTHPSEEPLYGVMQAKTVDVAAKVTGRVETLPVHEGDSARQSLVDEGQGRRKLSRLGPNAKSLAGQELAQKTFNRVHALYRRFNF